MDATIPSSEISLEDCVKFANEANGRYKTTRNMIDLDEAIDYTKQLLKLRSDISQNWNFLGELLNMRVTIEFSMQDLNDAIDFIRIAVDLRPPGDSDRCSSLINLAHSLHVRFIHGGDTKDLEEAISLNKESLGLRPVGHPNRDQALASQGKALLRSFQHNGRIQDLEDAIDYGRQNLELCPPGDLVRNLYLIDLANALHTRFEKDGTFQDLEEAIDCDREAVELCLPGDGNRNLPLVGLANFLRTRFELKGMVSDLDEAVDFIREALELCPPGHSSRTACFINIGAALFRRFEYNGVAQDLDEAVKFDREAVACCPPGNTNRGLALINLASALTRLYETNGAVLLLEEVIQCNKEVLELLPIHHHKRNLPLIGLVNALRARFERMGMVQDLDDAIEYDREALELSPPGQASRGLCFINLASALYRRFEYAGMPQDLEDAIECNRQAIELCQPGNPSRNLALINLGSALHTRFNQAGMMQDLEESKDCSFQALKLSPPGNSARNVSLINLGIVFHRKYEELGMPEDLVNSLKYNREALNLCTSIHPSRTWALTNLANALRRQFERSGTAEDLEEAIDCHRRALESCPPGHPHRGLALINLSKILSIHAGTDLHEATVYAKEAIDTLPSLHPMQATAKSDLANTYIRYYGAAEEGKEDFQLIEMALQLLEQSSSHPTSNILDRLKNAVDWANLARRFRDESSIRANTAALAYLNQRYVSEPTLDHQHRSLVSSAKIPKSFVSDAAASAVEIGRLDVAVELLEQGRSILWTRMRGYRNPLVTLREVDPELAEQFERLSRQLEAHATSANKIQPLDTPAHSIEREQRSYRRLTEEWDKVVENIRGIESFTDFLRPIPFSVLRRAAAEGPVIVVNISELRSDAIIVLEEIDPILVPLPNASPKTLALLASLFKDPRAATVERFSYSMRPILRAIWRLVVEPVVAKLNELQVLRHSRIWWCPTAELCALPLHAAGPYKPCELNLPDKYVSSYVPSLFALIMARINLSSPSKLPRLLLVAPPDEFLSAVEEEVGRIQQFGDFSTVVGAGASSNTVISKLQSHSWVHFACHGHRNAQPFHSYFELHRDERLELLDIMKAELPNAELAFLSACHGAAVDQDAPDESIHLASSLQFCGFRSVVGTLWAMADEDGPNVSEDFYRYMFREAGKADFKDAATALNLATREMRKRTGMSLGRWVNFVHIGA